MCTGGDFVSYIKHQQDNNEEGVDLQAEELIDGAVNKYNILLVRDKWMAKMPKEAKR